MKNHVSVADTGLPNVTRRGLLAAAPALALASVASESAASEPEAEQCDGPHPVLSLPFVRETSRAEQREGLPPRLFWSVHPTGNYTADCDTGIHFARLALNYMVKDRAPCIMQWAVFDMMRAGPVHSGIEVGFLSVFGQLAMVGQLLHSSISQVHESEAKHPRPEHA